MTPFISFQTLTRPPKPNTFLVAPAGICKKAEPDLVSPVFPASPRGLFSQISEIIASERSWKDLKADAETHQLHFIARTPLLGFRDDVDIAVLPAGDGQQGTSLAVYSRSRVGYSDLGANKKRVLALLDALTAK